MKFSFSVLCMLLASVASVHGQEDPGPSPTESVGCEPHGDHWHCDGPATTAPPAETTSASTTASEDPGPSPTESVGCEPHGDHWHCDGPAAATSVPSESSEAEDPGPSPTESVGCEPHGDHWHCEAPVSTGGAVPGAAVGYAAGALGVAAFFV